MTKMHILKIKNYKSTIGMLGLLFCIGNAQAIQLIGNCWLEKDFKARDTDRTPDQVVFGWIIEDDGTLKWTNGPVTKDATPTSLKSVQSELVKTNKDWYNKIQLEQVALGGASLKIRSDREPVEKTWILKMEANWSNYLTYFLYDEKEFKATEGKSTPSVKYFCKTAT
jgi:hypothetical protein